MIINGIEYTTGVDRNSVSKGKKVVAHLYRGAFHKPGAPMCRRGYSREDGCSYSIFRNQLFVPICKVCMRRAKQNKQPVLTKRKTNDK